MCLTFLNPLNWCRQGVCEPDGIPVCTGECKGVAMVNQFWVTLKALKTPQPMVPYSQKMIALARATSDRKWLTKLEAQLAQ